MTKVEICNLALGRIGRKAAITSLTENSAEARACARIWDVTRQALLREFTWGFSRKVALLALSTESIPGWEYLYAYPSDCLQALRIFNAAGAEYKGELDEDFTTVWAHSKLDGWKARKIADEWLHGCPKCGVPT